MPLELFSVGNTADLRRLKKVKGRHLYTATYMNMTRR